jgi:hypothetical protein
MSHSDGARNENEVNVVTDAEIRRSLLGCAEANEQEKFERELLLDDHLEQRVQRLELELADDFSFGRLTEVEREQFKANFLVNARRARILAVSQAIQKVVSAEPPQQLQSGWQRWLPVFVWERPFASAAIAVIIMAALGVLSWRVLRNKPEPLIAKQVPVEEPGREYAHKVSPAPSDVASDAGVLGRRVVATITLQADGASAAKQILNWWPPAAESDAVHFDLLLDGDTSGSYQVSMMGRGGQIAAQYDLKAESSPPRVSFNFAQILLPVGNYHIEVQQYIEGKLVAKRRYSFQSREN